MITVDPRVGSIDLQPLLASLHVKTEIRTLKYGDFCWEGQGPKGACMIGVERKRVRDFIASCRDCRLQDTQLSGMLEVYDYSFLVVEGVVRANPEDGLLEQSVKHGHWRPVLLGSTAFSYHEFHGRLATLGMKTPLHIIRTGGPSETAQELVFWHHWWADKEWDAHKSLHGFHTPPDPSGSIFRPGLVRRVAKELPGIGWDRSRAVAAEFSTVRELACAPVQRWVQIPGIGDTTAAKVVAAIEGRDIRE